MSQVCSKHARQVALVFSVFLSCYAFAQPSGGMGGQMGGQGGGGEQDVVGLRPLFLRLVKAKPVVLLAVLWGVVGKP